MEADWDELSRIQVPPPSPHGMPTIATAIAFDDVMELLWAGNEYVRSSIVEVDYVLICVCFLGRAESLPFAVLNYRGIPPSGHTQSPKAPCGRYFFMIEA